MMTLPAYPPHYPKSLNVNTVIKQTTTKPAIKDKLEFIPQNEEGEGAQVRPVTVNILEARGYETLKKTTPEESDLIIKLLEVEVINKGT